MKIANALYKNRETLGILNGEGFIPFTAIGIEAADINALLRDYSPEKLSSAVNGKAEKAEVLKEGEYILLAPIMRPAQDIICLGQNYYDHAVESMRFRKEAFAPARSPVYFSKRVNEAVADKGKVDGHFDIVDSLDYEAELAVIIGRDASKVRKEDVYDYVFGYTIINDISARNVQTAHKQWYFGKSLDGFAPMGPAIVTKDEIPGAPALDIKSYVNGELRQSANTGTLMYGIPYIISELSAGMTLKAGTIISTGTPSGVGMGFEPPKFLKPGDEVVCEIEKIGRLTNYIV